MRLFVQAGISHGVIGSSFGVSVLNREVSFYIYNFLDI